MSVLKVTGDNKHEGEVSKIVYRDGIVFSAGADKKIKVWDADLNFKKELAIHENYVYTIAVDLKGNLYSSSADGTVKFVEKPLESNNAVLLLQHTDEIETIFVDENNRFFTGNNLGVVNCFENGKVSYSLNLPEAIRSLFFEKDHCYTLFLTDLSINEVREHGKYINVGSIPGKYPVTLFGAKTEGSSKYIAILTRDGKGITVASNNIKEQYKVITVKENLHELIVNAMKGTGDFLFTCDYAGNVIKTQIVGDTLKEIAKFNAGVCANSLAVVDEKTVFVGLSDGTIKKIVF